MNNEHEFWAEVRKRRNAFYLAWAGWPVIGMSAILLYSIVFGHEAPRPFGYGLFIVWGALWFQLHKRILILRCPRCTQPAITHAFFFMKDAKCKNCGLNYKKE